VSSLRPVSGREHGTEIPTPPFEAFAPNANLLRPLQDLLALDGDRVIAMTREGDHFVDWTAAQILARVRALAKGGWRSAASSQVTVWC
jgi:hypothetical protein